MGEKGSAAASASRNRLPDALGFSATTRFAAACMIRSMLSMFEEYG
jgi:hypothetical protein